MRNRIVRHAVTVMDASGLLLAFIAFLSACAQSQPQSIDLDGIRTQAVSTYAFSLSKTLAPPPSTSPTVTSLPTFTPAVSTHETGTSVPQRSCYNLLYIEDRTIPDGTVLKANEVFTKTWLVQNNGDCAWAPGFRFSNVGGDSLRGRPVVLREPIPVGAKREISVEMATPGGVSGLVQSSWRMADEDGFYFGDTLSVNILIGETQGITITSTP
ncbi:MAG: hypothetical protein FJZ87_17165 [Chloroflexi bacterium]|nr:hypothetical protein [Chloroflexota bacterium]